MKIADAYDSMPYPSKFFMLTGPNHLSSLGRLHGIETKAPERCRVLELGCGNGSNLLSHAYNLEESEFVGIDISPEQIREAKRSARDLSLGNAIFEEIDLMELTVEAFGKFDFIVGHGLISWIPVTVRKRVFKIFNELLEQNGIGYLSYNAYPGSHYRDMIRRILRYHTRDTEEPLEKVNKGMDLLRLLSENSTEHKILRPIFLAEHERHKNHGPSDIYHDDLSPEYHPLHFHEFDSLLRANRMRFVCEAELQAMSAQGFGEEVSRLLSSFDEIEDREQYLDFLRGRIFRQTIFCRSEQELEREFRPESLDGFLIASAIKAKDPSIDVTKSTPQRFEGVRGVGLEIDHPLTKAALTILGKEWGRAVPCDRLLLRAREMLVSKGCVEADWEGQMRTTKAIILRILEGTDLVELRLFCPDMDRSLPERPRINRLARWQLGTADNITSLFGLNISVTDAISRRLLELADGSRTRNELLEGVNEFIAKNKDAVVENELPDDIGQWVDESIRELSKLGLFE